MCIFTCKRLVAVRRILQALLVVVLVITSSSLLSLVLISSALHHLTLSSSVELTDGFDATVYVAAGFFA
jgi:hypothetical protein